MKRTDLVRHLETYGCEFLREGGRHTVYVNRAAQRYTAIPRHREINNLLARQFFQCNMTSGFLRNNVLGKNHGLGNGAL